MSDENAGAGRPADGPRRRMARTALVAMLVAMALLIAACGGDGTSGGGDEAASADATTSPDATTSAGATTAQEGGGETAETAASTDGAQSEFQSLLGWTDADVESLRGKELKIGAILPLSGPGAIYGEEQGNGVALAIDQMKRLGVDVDYKPIDHKSGDPQAGASAARELGIDGYPIAINSYYGVFGSTLPSVQQYKMLSVDPGGGTGNGLKGQDFFYGFRANTPDDGFEALQYFKDTEPDKKRVAMVIWDAGAAYTDPIEAHLEEAVAENGMTYVGKLLQPIGATDYASIFSQLKEMDPDIIALVSYGADVGYFMKGYVNSGLDAQVLGSELTPDAAEIAGPAFDQYMFAADYFPVDQPPNPLSEFFITEYEQMFGEKPATFYPANFYEATLALFELARRVAANGGDINSGEELNQEMLADPTFKSVYGGDESTVGEIQLDAETHDPVVRPVGLFQANAGASPTQLAAWNIGGTDFEILDES